MRIRTGLVLCLLLLAPGVAGCGAADGGDGVATAGGRATATTSSTTTAQLSEQESQLQFARCMREHGIDMPDPEFEGGGISITIPEGTDPQKVDAAQQECKQYLPNGGEPQKMDPQLVEQQREFSKCMRENGVPEFPDPDENGGIRIEGGPGLDPRSPEFQAAEEACAQYQPAPPSGGPTRSVQIGGTQ